MSSIFNESCRENLDLVINNRLRTGMILLLEGGLQWKYDFCHSYTTHDKKKQWREWFKEDFPNNQMTITSLERKFNACFSKNENAKDFCQYFFKIFDMNKNGVFGFEEFFTIIDVINNGSAEEKLKMILKPNDLDGRISTSLGKDCLCDITQDELMNILQDIFIMPGTPKSSQLLDSAKNISRNILSKMVIDETGYLQVHLDELIEICLQNDDLVRTLTTDDYSNFDFKGPIYPVKKARLTNKEGLYKEQTVQEYIKELDDRVLVFNPSFVSPEEKLKMALRLFVHHSKIENRKLFSISHHCEIPIFTQHDAKKIIQNIYNKMPKTKSATSWDNIAKESARNMSSQMKKDERGYVSEEEFIKICLRNDELVKMLTFGIGPTSFPIKYKDMTPYGNDNDTILMKIELHDMEQDSSRKNSIPTNEVPENCPLLGHNSDVEKGVIKGNQRDGFTKYNYANFLHYTFRPIIHFNG